MILRISQKKNILFEFERSFHVSLFITWRFAFRVQVVKDKRDALPHLKVHANAQLLLHDLVGQIQILRNDIIFCRHCTYFKISKIFRTLTTLKWDDLTSSLAKGNVHTIMLNSLPILYSFRIFTITFTYLIPIPIPIYRVIFGN